MRCFGQLKWRRRKMLFGSGYWERVALREYSLPISWGTRAEKAPSKRQVVVGRIGEPGERMKHFERSGLGHRAETEC
jgi:hypothetical protein